MFNLMSFLIGVGFVFAVAFTIFLIGELTDWYDSDDAIVYFMLGWFGVIVGIIKWLWEHRLIQRVTKEQYERIINVATDKHPDWTFEPKHLFGNVYSITWNCDKANHPIRSRLRMITIVKK